MRRARRPAGAVRATAALAAAMLVMSACGTLVDRDERLAARASSGGPAGGDGLAAGDPAEVGDAAADGAFGGGADGTAGDPGGDRASGGASAGGGGGAGGGATQAGSGQASAAGNGESMQGIGDTEIKIGASGPLSGVTGFLGEEAFGAIDSYFQLVNARGGVNGRKLRLIALDDRFDSSQTLANVRRLWEEEKVAAIFLAFGDPVADYVTRHQIPTLVFGVTPKSFASKYPTVYPLVGNALLWTQEVIAGLKDRGVFKQGMRVGMLYDTQILDVSPYVPFLKQSWENAGAQVVSTDPFNLSDGDCTSLVLKMRQLEIDYWDFQGLGWVLCVAAASRQRYRPPIGWGNWPTSVAGLASQVGPWVEGVWGGSQGDQPDGKPRQKTAAHDEFVQAIQRYHPNIASFGHLESPPTLGYWVGARMLVAAIEAQGQVVTKDGINGWIQGLENFDVGVTPPVISMAPNCKTGSEIVWIGRWKWDAEKSEATRVPETGYFTSDQKDKFGGKCFLTEISDDLER